VNSPAALGRLRLIPHPNGSAMVLMSQTGRLSNHSIDSLKSRLVLYYGARNRGTGKRRGWTERI